MLHFLFTLPTLPHLAAHKQLGSLQFGVFRIEKICIPAHCQTTSQVLSLLYASVSLKEKRA